MASFQSIKEFDSIFKRDKTGKLRVWKVTVEKCPITNVASAHIEHGVFGGKLQVDTLRFETGKNIGKKNETTPVQQCLAEMERKRKDKIEKEGYIMSDVSPAASSDDVEHNEVKDSRNEANSSSEASTTVFRPMLAHTLTREEFDKRIGANKPFAVQPKLDGLRCVIYTDPATGKLVAQSRTGSFFTSVDHILESIGTLPSNVVLDGELYTMDIPFEMLAGLIKKKKLTAEDKAKLRCVEYHVYDMVDRTQPNASFDQRNALIGQLAAEVKTKPYIKCVETHTANNWQSFYALFQQYIEVGYEGAMVRTLAGKYAQGQRSRDLLKYKEFHEAEFEITGFKEGTGRETGLIIWECKTPEGRTFDVRPKGSHAYRAELFREGAKYVGKPLTVIYQELSEYWVPRFPVGKAVREGGV